DGTSVWSSELNEHARDLFDVEDHVADGVARSVIPSLSARDQQLLTKRTTDDVEAYELYMQGLYWGARDPARAIELYQLAIARDAKFAAAWSATADSWLMRARFTNLPPHEL